MNYTRYLADIDPNEYEAFRRLMGSGIPHTFKEWAEKRDEAVAQITSRGNEAILIQVHPDEVAVYCRSSWMPAIRTRSITLLT